MSSQIETDLNILDFCKKKPYDDSCKCLNYINFKKSQTKQPRYCTHPPCIFRDNQKIPSYLLRDIKTCGINNTCKFHIKTIDGENTKIELSNDCDNLSSTRSLSNNILDIPIFSTEIIFNDFFVEYFIISFFLFLISLVLISIYC